LGSDDVGTDTDTKTDEPSNRHWAAQHDIELYVRQPSKEDDTDLWAAIEASELKRVRQWVVDLVVALHDSAMEARQPPATPPVYSWWESWSTLKRLRT
jgi:hypothetical protein